jgi:hypothetical protein
MRRDGSDGYGLWVLLGSAAVYRVSLLGRGATAFVDETLYFTTVIALQSLVHGDLRGAAHAVTVARGRQIAPMVQLPLAAAQSLPSAFGVPASNLRSLLIPTASNVLVSLALVYVVFKICRLVSRDAWSALAATFMFAFLVNTNLYVRHLLPYDWSLVVALSALWIAMTREPTPWCAFFVGAMLGAVVGLYSGYYLTALVVAAALITHAAARGVRHTAMVAVCLGAGGAAIVAVLEVVCRAGGISYVESSRVLSRSITLGAFAEGWTFLPEYLLRVEHASGVVLMIAAVAALGRAAWHGYRRTVTIGDVVIAAAVAGWLLQVVLAVYARTFVFYGRLIHPWFAFMTIALAGILSGVKNDRLRRAVCAAVVTIAVVSWLPSAIAYYGLAYPPDVLYTLKIDTTRLSPERMICELTEGTSYASPGPFDRTTRAPYSDRTDYLLVNFCQGAPSRRLRIDTVGMRRIFDGPHWLSFPAYSYEGLTPDERAEIVDGSYRVQAFEPPNSANVRRNYFLRRR